MLNLQNITKIYGEKTDGEVNALGGISLAFRRCEFVSVLGPSGCGKTTLLNIIGGLDRYTSGNLTINGKATENYSDYDWDTYRNHSVGFVFQNYNLIPYQTILENVELAMTLGGTPKAERRSRAIKALKEVGLSDKMNKKPNELSGGQMQRVSIARALVGNPDIILADEPTGAIDSDTSETIMQLLKEISRTRLVIMVTHNSDLAMRFSDRIIKMLDGKIIGDTSPYTEQSEIVEDKRKYTKKHSSMSFLTAIKLSTKNLLSKKKRTAITSIAASIGIIGIAVILSVSSGMQAYIDKQMMEGTSFNFVSISTTVTNYKMLGLDGNKVDLEEYPDTLSVIPYVESLYSVKEQIIPTEFVDYIDNKASSLVVEIKKTYGVKLNILTTTDEGIKGVSTSNWKQSLANTEYLRDKYTVLVKDESVSSYGIPEKANEIALVVDSYNRLSTTLLKGLGYDANEGEEIPLSEFIGKEYRVVFNDGWYTPSDDGVFREPISSDYENVYNSGNGITVKIISVLRENENASASWLTSGIAYSPLLTDKVLENNANSKVAVAQLNNEDINVTTGKPFNTGEIDVGALTGQGSSSSYNGVLEKLGNTTTPSSITIYPKDIDARKEIVSLIDEWNDSHDKIEYIDMSGIATSILGSVVDVITYVLLAFSAVSLVISSIMIAIIIYASVIERIREIGVLRSLGARKKDISRVFITEAVLLGALSGVIAIALTLLINLGLNAILSSLLGVSGIAALQPVTALALIALGIVLLLLASLIPARIAAKKQPAVALRSE